MSSVLQALTRRRSYSKVTEAAPSTAELLPLIEAAARVADHSSLKPWRIIEIREDARVTLGRAIHKAEGKSGVSVKPMRSSLLLAVVFCKKKSSVPGWEQEAVASGVAHALSLLLDDAGWGVFWRTGKYTRSQAVAKAHGLKKNEQLMGWLYVGGKPENALEPRKRVDAASFLSPMPERRAKS